MPKISINNVWRLNFLKLLRQHYTSGHQLNNTRASEMRLQCVADVEDILKQLDAKGYNWKDLERVVEDLPNNKDTNRRTARQARLLP